MAIELATKYSTQVDETIRKGLLSTAGTNNDVDFVGAQTVKIYSMGVAPLNDYNVDGGMQRYGTPVELQDTTQEMKMTQQKSFTFTIDKTHAADSPEGIRDAGRALQRQIDQAIIPEIDRYRFAKFAEEAGTKNFTAITSDNAYAAFVAANTAITDEEIPTEGRVAFCSSDFIGSLKNDGNFTKANDLAQDRIIFKGMVGDCDGVSIIQVPKRRMPAGVSFIITHPMCAPAPVKLQEYTIHANPPGIAGHLVEGLLYHDVFVFENKKCAIAVNYGVLETLTVAMTAAAAGTGAVVVTGNTNGGTLVYKANGSVTAPKLGEDLSSWTVLPADGIVTAASGNKIVVALRNKDNKAVATSAATTVTVGA